MKKIIHKIRIWILDKLLEESGVDLSPEPNVWGVLSQAEEDNVLAQLWENKLWVALKRKYAEGANKAVLARTTSDKEFWQFKAKFMVHNSELLKARRAALKLKNEKPSGDKI